MVALRLLRGGLGRHALGIALVGTVVGLIGPYGTFFGLPLATRLPYWLLIVALSWGQWLLIEGLIARWSGWPATAVGSLTGLLLALPMTAEVVLLNRLFGLRGPETPATLTLWIAVTALLLFWLVHMVLRWSGAGTRAASSPAQRGEAVFGRRIPPRIAGRLLCLRTEDHYLRVYTSAGDDLILMRLRDAVAELAAVDGLQVHRSYWVARDAVARSERQGRRRVLVLSNGLEVPVSESRLPALRAAGWLD